MEKISDPLLACLLALSKHYQQPASVTQLLAGLPLVNQQLTPQLFVRAAKRANLSAKISERTLGSITPIILPIVLILKDNQSCILQRIRDNEAEIFFPHTEETKHLTLLELEKIYSGYMIFVRPRYLFDKRAIEFALHPEESWFWGTLSRFWRLYSRVIAASFLVNLFALASPIFIMNVYDRVVPNQAFETLWALAIGVSLVFLFDFIMRMLRGYFIDAAGKKADVVMASSLFEHLLGVRMEKKPSSSGVFASQVREFETLREFFTSATLTSIIDLPFLFLFLAFIAIIGGYLVWIPLFAIPITLITAFITRIPLQKAVETSALAAAQKNAILIEVINGLETIKGLSAEGLLQSKWERYLQVTAQAGMESRFFSAIAVNVTMFVTQIATVILIIAGVYAISVGDLSMGGLIACSILGGRALAPLAQIAQLIIRFQQSRIALNGLDKIMKLPMERPAQKQFLHRASLTGDIEFMKVSFAYPAHGKEKAIAVLQDISFHIKPQEKVGIIGRTGSGKTTIDKLILSLYAPITGQIRLDGIDITQIDPADLRHNVGYVPQHDTLFFGTVRSNIVMGLPDASDEEILKAAELAGVEEFVKKHPAGYDLPIGEQGDGLSGGQRQAIAIARSIVTNPAILVWDEPTSAMDSTSESEFIQKMTFYLKNRTLILVTHKASLLALVDRLIVIDGGRVVADGAKDKVMTALSQSKIAKAE